MLRPHYLVVVAAAFIYITYGQSHFDPNDLPLMGEYCSGDICKVSGDPHFMTFDCVKYSYHGHCEYTLIKTCNGGSGGGDSDDNEAFEVTGLFERLRYNPQVSVVKSISIAIAGSVVILDDKFDVFIDGDEISDQAVSFYPWGVIKNFDNAVVVFLQNGVTIYWCSPYEAMFVVNNTEIQLCGLCGSNNGNKSDEFESGMNEQVSGHGSISFGDGWRTNPETCGPCKDCTDTVCQINKDNNDHAQDICQLFIDGSLPDCGVDVDHQAMYDKCVADMCAFLPELTNLCTRVYDYIRKCSNTSLEYVDFGDLEVCGSCQEDEFRCNDGSCIPDDFYCDIFVDCPDLSDEPNDCETSSSGSCNGFQCNGGECIPSDYYCDIIIDCDDESDEPSDCVYTSDDYDNYESYSDYSYYYSSGSCNEYEFQFQCFNGGCIPGEWECDGIQDCRDNEDESDCANDQVSCADDEFPCPDGQCILNSWVCDGFDDCDDNSDEPSYCQYSSSSYWDNFSSSSSWDINYSSSSSWDLNYPSSSSRDNYPSSSSWDNYPGSSSWDINYSSSSSWDNYPSSSSWDFSSGSCTDDQFKCLNGHCIPTSWFCDQDNDCDDYSDEPSYCQYSSSSFYPSSWGYSSGGPSYRFPFVKRGLGPASHPLHPSSTTSSTLGCSKIRRRECHSILPYSVSANMLFPGQDKTSLNQIYKILISRLDTTIPSHQLFACALVYPECPKRKPNGQFRVPCRQLCIAIRDEATTTGEEDSWPIDCDQLPVDVADDVNVKNKRRRDGLCIANTAPQRTANGKI